MNFHETRYERHAIGSIPPFLIFNSLPSAIQIWHGNDTNVILYVES